MDLGEIFNYVNFVLNRDQLGDPASPDKFDMLIKRFSLLHYEDEYQKLLKIAVENGVPISELMYENGPMKHFEMEKSYDYGTYVPLHTLKPEDFKHKLSINIFSENAWRPVEIMAPKSFDNATRNLMRNPIEEFPIGREYADKFYILPTPSKIKLSYIREVLEPTFDYCIDSGDNVVYMPPGSYLSQGTTDPPYSLNLIGEDDIPILYGVAHPTNPPRIPYFSLSVELDWKEEHKNPIINDIISACSVRAREMDVSQNAKLEKQ